MRLSVLLWTALFISGAARGMEPVYSCRFGVTTGSLLGDYSGMDRGLRGLQIGGLVLFPLSDYSFQTGIVYTQKGGKIEEAGDSLSLRLDYLQIPAMARFPIADGRGFATGGLALGFRLRSRTELSVGGDGEVYPADYIGATEIALGLGGGLTFDIEESVGTFEILYEIGLTDFDRDAAISGYTSTLTAAFSFSF